VEASGKDINPDVIGYIFEKYINDRSAMGAYYTKGDITDYIGKNTIIPFLFDKVKKEYPKAFKADDFIWSFLQASGDTYIYDAVKKGVPQDGNLFDDLPEEVKAGFLPELGKEVVKDSSAKHLWEIRKCWNKKAPEEIALPTEIYREVIERRKRYAEIKLKIEKGKITEINDFITYNLNIRQFAQDIMENSDDPDFIRQFFKAIKSVTILDPTCGSGAFLFAAMNILEPLYETCIERMEQFTAEEPRKYKFFHEVLAEVNSEEHPNLGYYIYKTIILNNLYGVDIMHEAVEIAKLRLFLKMVGAVDINMRKPNYGLEPLPDVDFNIRAGNTLVGFASEDDFKKAVHEKDLLFAKNIISDFEDEFAIIAKAFKFFQGRQLTGKGGETHKEAKIELQKRLDGLNEKLNKYLASTYGIDKERGKKKYTKWLESHQPFHWLAEFYEIINGNGGFDVVIGNPPYIVYTPKKVDYTLENFKTYQCKNLYAYVVERGIGISKNQNVGFIIPSAAFGTKTTQSIRELVMKDEQSTYISFLSGDAHPATLFEGVNLRLSIIIKNSFNKRKTVLYSTKYLKWYAEERDELFNEKLIYRASDEFVQSTFPKVYNKISGLVLRKMLEYKKSMPEKYSYRQNNNIIYYHNAPVFFIRAMNFVPAYESATSNEPSSNHFKTIYLQSKFDSELLLSVFNSSIFFYWFTNYSANRDLTSFDINGFPLICTANKKVANIPKLNRSLMDDLKKHSVMREYQYTTGKVRYQEFYMRKSKPIIDQIDCLLAQHYGFTEEELDFIINYDIKYRMGKKLDAYIECAAGKENIKTRE